MKIESHHSGVLRIWMTAADMARWGLTWETMANGDETTDRALLRLLRVVRQRIPEAYTGRICVEAIPLYGGCLLLFSQLPNTTSMPPRLYRLESADEVMQLASALGGICADILPRSSLYREDDRYWLVLYGSLPMVDEFATLSGEGALAVSYVQEHGEPLALEGALNRLQASCGSR